MTKSIKLSERLKKVATYLPKGAHFADIGSDHAYLPCYVCLHDEKATAIAGEINEGPYKSALETVLTHQLNDVIDVRLGNGLQILQEGEVSELVIAGMGGALIKTILEEGKKKLASVQRIIAQPNVDEKNVRKWLFDNGFTVTNEAIVKENGHIYEIIVADRAASENPYMDTIKEKQLLFGPFLLKDKSAIFFQKWKSERAKLLRVIDQMNRATVRNNEKMDQFETKLNWIEEVLANDKDTH